MERFIGIWKNKDGNILEIKPNNKKSLKVTFISGRTGKPIIRDYYKGKESVEMFAELDYYESSLEVELGEKGSGFKLSLLYDWIDLKENPGYKLAPGLIQNMGDTFMEKYGHLFGPLDYYERIDK